MKPIYTIGYQRLRLARLVEIVQKLDGVLVDVRSVPYSHRKEFSRPSLEEALGNRYVWKGRDLGGRAPITRQGIDWLRQARRRRTLLLMCMEHDPADCHRHHAICARYFPDALHIFGDQQIEARELERSMRDDDE